MKKLNEKITANEAIQKLLEKGENGSYKIGQLSGSLERENLTQVVSILNQIDLTKEDEKGFKDLRKALGIIGAYDRYAYLGSEGKINTLREFNEKSQNGDLAPARMYVNKFLGNMDAFSRAQIDDKFSDIMEMWVEVSGGMIKKNGTVFFKDVTKNALDSGVRDGEVVEVDSNQIEEEKDYEQEY